jgi:serine/threonine protein kinase/Tol biopolymer transport system component
LSLVRGARLGPYEIVSALGAGGMGEVYRAHDSKLNRDVAIKVLPETVAADPDRLARFRREAQVLASLNHPNIGHIYGFEDSGPTHALVLELVEGPTLADRIAQGAIPLTEALPIARQIAEALEAAHEQGIIHRDLKPANIKVRPDGTVKVLDFGLAKALDPPLSSSADAMASPTLTARATQMGMIMGTAAYMAPEQARGKAADRRADVWAFGVVLYEMLTGRRAFDGDDISITLANVLKDEVSWAALPADMPASVRRLLRRCLEKEPRKRLSAIGDARLELDEPDPSMATTDPRTLAPNRSIGVTLAASLVVITLIATAGITHRWFPAEASSAATPPASTTRLQIALPSGFELYSAVGAAISLSPDGRTLAFVGVRSGVRQVFLRRLDAFDITPIRGTESAVSCLFSPDGRNVLVGAADTSLRRVRLVDGLVEMVVANTSEYLGGWLSNDRVVFTKGNRLWMADVASGSPMTQLTEEVAGSSDVESQPVPVPGADAVLFVSGRPDALDRTRIEALRLSDHHRTIVVERASNPVMTPTGRLLFLRDGTLLAAPFDGAALKITGEAVPVLPDVAVVRNRGMSALATVSATGTLVYASTKSAIQGDVVSVSRGGDERTILTTELAASNPRLTPDGRRLLFEEMGGGLWTVDLERHTLARLTDGATLAAFPIFTRDGRGAVFRSQNGLFTQPLDGGAKPVQIQGSEANEYPNAVSPDGTELIFTKISPTTGGDLFLMPLAGGKPRVLIATAAYEGGGAISPDGHWFIYVSNDLGASEIFLQPYPALNQRYQVSASGGVHPVWNPKGGEIFYRNGDRIMSVRMTVTAAGPVLASPVALFSGRYAYGGGLTIPNFTASADGDRFILVKERSGASLNVVLNWFEELKRGR